ncbi:tetratricopeptide repeat protein [Aureibaculum sp. 2210JD6-5]|uniref:tetratricopeptide repeat protein n=1 Tax=Aureibaculum sp. 2210JD6-5 TaxID=3103957 RepID=UPI002AAD87C7|nr:tetratricopeptide repeat protein [Aureibaculum sp. 2210JD6-5]MDY7396457.1 tetratricopeptide repeat protein [Aureibaculum sp. 2210JD6-5]
MRQLIFFLLLLFSTGLNAQNTKLIDSLKLELKNNKEDDTVKVAILGMLHERLMYSKPEEAKNYSLKELEISKKIGYKKGIATGNRHIGNYYENRSEYDSALHYYTKAKKHYKEINNNRGLIFVNHSLSSIKQSTGALDEAISLTNETLKIIEEHEKEGDLKTKFIGAQHNVLANIYIQKGSYRIALLEALKALKYLEEINDEARRADVIKQIGDIESNLENHEKSIEYFKQAIDIYKKLDDKVYLAYAYNSLGISYQNLKDYKNAETSYNSAISYAKEVDAKLPISGGLLKLAELEIINKNYPKAKQLLMDTKAIAEKENLQLRLADAYSLLSQIDYQSNNFSDALNKNNRAIIISKTNGTLPLLQNLYQYRSEILDTLNQHKEAVVYLKASQKIKDSLFSNKKIQQIEELRTIYETEKKEQEIKNQKNEIDLLNVKNKVSNQQRLLLGLGLLLAIIGLYAFYQRLKRSKVEKEIMKADLEFKTKELTTHALHLAKKNEVLNDLKQKAKVLKADANADPGYQMLIQTINFDLQDDNNWENFSKYFQEVYKDFNSNAQQKFPAITTNDLRLMALLKMNLSSKEIANILNISHDGIKKARQRLRKKMGIDSDQSLEAIIIAI